MSQLVPIKTFSPSPEECFTLLTGLVLQRARRVDIILGMPRHNCRFHGICKVEEHGVSPLPIPYVCNNKVAGWLELKLANRLT